MSILVIYITHENQSAAEKVGAALVREKLAACYNLFPIKSAYWWQGAVQSNDEWVTILKTTRERWNDLVRRTEELHPYEVPCILKIEAEANPAYEAWVTSATTDSD